MSWLRFIIETSRSTRLIWALEELGLDYDLVEYERHPKDAACARRGEGASSAGRFPMLEIDGKVIVESGAILTYLVERQGRLGPPMAPVKITPTGCIMQRAQQCFRCSSS